MKTILTLENKIEVKFKNSKLLEEALTHRSFINESKEKNIVNNERLEFLGDAVIELVVTEYLFNTYPTYNEGELTSFRSALVRTESLADEAVRLEIGAFIHMSNGEDNTGGRNRPYILANTFEALIGAIYLDQGYAEVKNFIVTNLCYKVENIIKNRLDIDPKSRLQQIAQEKFKITPTYKLITETGPDHNKEFIMAAMLESYEMGKGTGDSKQSAEQAAANATLDRWDEIIKEFPLN